VLIRRPGFTLPEVLIALSCASILFATIASIALRQQRLFAELADDAATTGRLREVVATMPIDLRALSPAAGDIRDARDTSLEVRATIASAVVCDTTGRSLILGPALRGAGTFADYLTTIAASDTAWLLDLRDSTEQWIPRRITSVSTTNAGRCASGGPTAIASFTATAIVLDTIVPARVGTVLRVTRPVRYSLYRSLDGSWQLGARDWNTATLRFNTIQPVAGPLLPASAHGLALSYADASGATPPRPADSASGLSLIRITAHAQTTAPLRVLGGNGGGRKTDSLDAAVFLHNRR
jgi:prepilin-type N-terminal cleavage/methylation domain-containing protein